MSIINHTNLKVTKNIDNSWRNVSFSRINSGIRFGLNYRIYLKNNYFLSPAIYLSIFHYELLDSFNLNDIKSSFWISNYYANAYLMILINKKFICSKYLTMTLKSGLGYCYSFNNIRSTYVFTWQGKFSRIGTSGEWDKNLSSPAVQFGITCNNARFTGKRLEYGLSYLYIFRNLPGIHVLNYIDIYEYEYSVHPSVSFISLDLVYKLNKLNEP